jgi:hypothetical protein
VKPGDRLPITGVEWRIATSAGKVLKTPALPGGGKPNPYCANYTPMAGAAGLNDPDDAQSVGSVVILGQFRAADFGDLWRTKELELMCPNNPSGPSTCCSRPATRDCLESLPFMPGLRRVVLMQRHPQGGAPEPMKTVPRPRSRNLWQMHWSYAPASGEHPALFIANIEDAATIAGVLTAPPRGGGPGAARGGAPADPAAATPPAATPPATPAQADLRPPRRPPVRPGNATGHASAG